MQVVGKQGTPGLLASEWIREESSTFFSLKLIMHCQSHRAIGVACKAFNRLSSYICATIPSQAALSSRVQCYLLR